ncbi:MAG: hypothetical protein AAGF25_05550 [Pseudomonadota bacterium]
MNILQDLVLLHSKKPDENFPVGLVYDPEQRSSSYLELIVIGFGALVMLGVATILSIPDKERQEELKNIDMGREIVAEPCDDHLTSEDAARIDSLVPALRPCVN